MGCTTDDHCRGDLSSGGECELETSRCRLGSNPDALDGDPCAVNDDCGPTQGCLLGRCVTLECDLGGERACTNGWTCAALDRPFDVLFYLCAEPCTAGAGECPEDLLVCLPEEADVGGLVSGDHCAINSALGGGLSPEAQIGDPCTTNADCPPRGGLETCEAGICASYYCEAASLPSDLAGCETGAVCHTRSNPTGTFGRWYDNLSELGICRRDCSSDPAVCATGTSCFGGICVADG